MFKCNENLANVLHPMKYTPVGAHFDIQLLWQQTQPVADLCYTGMLIPVFHLEQTLSTSLMPIRRPNAMRALCLFVEWTLYFALWSHNGNICLKRNAMEPSALACFHRQFKHSYPWIIMANVVKSNAKGLLLHLSTKSYLTVPLGLNFTGLRF